MSFPEKVGFGHGVHQPMLSSYANLHQLTSTPVLDALSLNKIRKIYQSYIRIKKDFPEIQRALELFNSVNFSQSENSSFRVPGLFSVIEMLITHKPGSDDRGDSITRQIKFKMALLNHRFDEPLDFVSYFGHDPKDMGVKIWSALYSYRSAIAHGSNPDFDSKSLKILKNKESADAFLEIAVKKLLRHCLEEPQLYRDLSAC